MSLITRTGHQGSGTTMQIVLAGAVRAIVCVCGGVSRPWLVAQHVSTALFWYLWDPVDHKCVLLVQAGGTVQGEAGYYQQGDEAAWLLASWTDLSAIHSNDIWSLLQILTEQTNGNTNTSDWETQKKYSESTLLCKKVVRA